MEIAIPYGVRRSILASVRSHRQQISGSRADRHRHAPCIELKRSSGWPGAAINGVDAGCGTAPRPKILIHIDRGGDVLATKHFLDKCQEYGVPYDVIGQSYYPWWHGSPDDLRRNLAFMAEKYEKDIILVEVAFNWRPSEYRDRPGPVPETPEGQRDFLAEVNQIVLDTPGRHGKGIFWWEPAVTPGPIASRSMFDGDGNPLPVINVIDRSARGEESSVGSR